MHKPHIRYKDQTTRERTWTIHLISLEKVVKATIAIALALKLLTLLGQDVHQWASDFVSHHGINLANKYVQDALEKLIGFGNTQIYQLSAVAFVYAGLLYVEGIGLWLQKRWAEYLTVFATAIFIPVELYEIYERPTWIRIGILFINIFIVWYLSTRLRDEKAEQIEQTATALRRSDDSDRVITKICGITSLIDAKNALDAGADELGFNFYTRGKRYISPDDAKVIVNSLPPETVKIGVFVNEPIDDILRIAETVGIDGIQLHGDEDDDFESELIRRTDTPVIRVYRIASISDIAAAMSSNAAYILFDAFSADERGGTGKTADWKMIAAEIDDQIRKKLYIAGGLTADNVATAIDIIRPHAVDVASGVESSPGKKDPNKLRSFIRSATLTIDI